MTSPQKLLHSLSPHTSVLVPSQGSPDKSKLGSVHFPQMSSPLKRLWGFPGGSAGKESACNTEDPGSIPESGRSPREGIGYALQYSWASLVVQIVKQSICNEENLGLIPGLGRSPGGGYGQRSLIGYNPWGCKELDMTE